MIFKTKCLVTTIATLLLAGCGGGDSSSGNENEQEKITFNLSSQTQTSFRASSGSSAVAKQYLEIAPQCYGAVCISDDLPSDGELPITQLPAAEHSNPEWKALDHHMISSRFHLISGGYNAQSSVEECDGYNKPYETCMRPVVEMYLYDTSSKQSNQVMAVAGAPFGSVDALSKDLINSLQWIEPNSRYNNTEKLFMWGQLNARHDDEGKTECGATKHLWEFDPVLADFKLAHVQQCILDDNGTVSDWVNADSHPVVIDSAGYVYIPFINHDNGEMRYDISPQSEERPVKLDTVTSLQKCENLVVVDQSETGFIFACGDYGLSSVSHLEKTAVNIPETILNSGNDYSSINNASWSNVQGTGKESGYMLAGHQINAFSGLAEQVCTIPAGYQTEYSENYCVSWEDGTGKLVATNKLTSQVVINDVIDELVSPPDGYSYVVNAKIDADEQNIYLGIMTTYNDDNDEIIDSKMSYVNVSLSQAVTYPMHGDLVSLELR